MAEVTVTKEKIGLEDISVGAHDATWNRTTSIGGTVAMTKVSVQGIEASTSAVTQEDLVKLHAITATAARLNGAPKIGTFDMSANGAQTVSGVGFQPSCVIFFAAFGLTEGTTTAFSWGFDDATNHYGILTYVPPSGTRAYEFGNLVSIVIGSGANVMTSKIASFNADGFVLTNALTGTCPATVYYMAFP